MRTVSISELKAHLSKYLREVRRGGEVQVLDRGVPIARIVGLEGAVVRDADRRQRLIRAGIIRPGRGDASQFLDEPPIRLSRHADISGALTEEREDRV